MKKIAFVLIGLIFLFSSFLVFSQTIDVTTQSNWFPDFHNTVFNSICVDGNIIYGCSQEYGIYKSNDNGKTFVSINNFTDLSNDATYEKVAAKDNIVFLSTSRGTLRSSDYGMTWTTIMGGFTKQIIFQNDTIFVGNYFGGYMFSTDNGVTWISKSEGLPLWNGLSSFNKSGNHLMVSIGNEGIFYSSNNGDSWEKRNNGLNNLWIKEIVSIDNVFYLANGEGISKTTDFGLNWTQINEGCTGGSPLITDGDYVYTSTWGNGIYRRKNDDTSWELFYLNYEKVYPYLRSLFIKDSKIYLSIEFSKNNSFKCSEDSGNTWTTPSSSAYDNDTRRNVHCMLELNNKIYTGTQEGLLFSSDFGKTWQLNTSLPNHSTINHINYFDNTLFVATNSGIYSSSDFGNSWEQIFNKASNFISGTTNFLYTGEKYNNEGIYRSSDYGVSWQQINNGLTDPDIRCMTQSGNNLLVGSYNKGIFKSTDWGDNWTLVYEANDNLYSFFAEGANVFAGAWWSRHRSTDNGNTWTNLNVGGNVFDFKKINNKIYTSGFISFTEDYGNTWTGVNLSGLFNFMVKTICGKTSKLLAGTNGRAVCRQINFTGDLGSIDVGKKSDPYPYLVSGYELNENITVTVPDGFEVSKSPFDGYGSSVTLTENEDLVIYNEVYIRFAPTKAKTYGPVNITHTSNGAATKYVSVTGIGVAVPPELTTTAATNITSSKANTGGNVTFDGGDDVTERGICWNKTGNPVITDNKLAGGEGTGEFISQLKGLKANTQYFVRAYAINSAATAYGNEINFNTGNPTLPELTTSDVMFVTNNSAQSGGEITDEGGADITAKGVCWNKTGSPTILDNYTTETTEGNTFTSNLTNLEENTTYFVRAYSTNSKGTNYGNEIIFKTAAVGILLNQGWNMISSCVVPQSTGLTDIFSEIINKVVILKNQTGEVFIPQFSIDQITNWNQTQGYQIYLSSSATLYIKGNYAVPQNTPIAVKNGWNLISYLRNTQMDAPTALASLTDNGNLVIAKDLAGNVYIPSFGINSLGDLKPGVGYRIYVTNNDNLVYPPNFNATEEVLIGNQVWKKKNLDTDHYLNGDPIPQVTDPTQWANLTTGAWCYYNNDPANGAKYGKLYNWYAVNDPRGLAPAGYHVPDNADWMTLVNYLGGVEVAGGKLKLNGLEYWKYPNEGATNTSGFTGLPGGFRFNTGVFNDLGNVGVCWSSTELNATDSKCFGLSYFYSNISISDNSKVYGFSVRCIKD